MNLSVRVLFEQLFDYAGLFPPSKLPLDIALSNYVIYQNHPYKEMLGKFILPALQCKNASSFFKERTIESALGFSILLSQAKSEQEILSFFHNDINNLHYLPIHSGKCFISSFEICLPLDCYSWEKDKLFVLFNGLMKHLNSAFTTSNKFDLFCEMPFLEHAQMMQFLAHVHKFNSVAGSRRIFIKLRTGGTTPGSIPAAADLANAIMGTAKFSIPFKVTAGLHVPTPHFNPDVNAHMHGFLNVLFAAILAYNISEFPHTKDNIEDVLKNLNFNHLNVLSDQTKLRIPSQPENKFVFTKQMIHDFRKNYFRGIGSCDFLDPIQHLNDKMLFDETSTHVLD